ncbi:hypothetical protein BH11PSE11_BH11PSE11_07580 [soil metagenome]
MNNDNQEEFVVTSMSVCTGVEGDGDAGMFTTMSMEFTRGEISRISIPDSGAEVDYDYDILKASCR